MARRKFEMNARETARTLRDVAASLSAGSHRRELLLRAALLLNRHRQVANLMKMKLDRAINKLERILAE